MTQSLGTTYAVTIPSLSDNASVTDAFKYYHQGGLSGSPTTNSVEQYLINVNNRAGSIETAIGWPYGAGTSLSTRVSGLETTVNTNLSSTYVKSVPSSNDTAATRNLVSPSSTSVIPLQIQGLVGQTASLQEWKTSAATVAKVDSTGKVFSHDGSSMAEVATISGTQTITGKTLTSPTINGGSLNNATTITLTGSQASTSRVRNIVLSTSDPTGGSDGDVWIKYV
jgi:hypothetical protein